MMLLTPILIVPAAAALLCLVARSRQVMAAVNVAAFGLTVALGVQLLRQVVAPPHVVTEWEEFFRADALSAWMVLLISVVSLGSSLYAGNYFRRGSCWPGG
jgi:formate hydrogenlyase subunit 3/multisubunit Na+/H+ antiporter MnhD subunit